VSRIAVLGYHKVGLPGPGAWETWFYVPKDVFAAHLTVLRDGGWQPVDGAAFLRGLAEPGMLPERAALITFDDGYRSVFDVALPILERFDYPGVLFVPTDFVGRTNLFDAESEPEEPLCDWSELRELERRGVAVESHAASHRTFSELTPSERALELQRSKAALEAGLGQTVQLFAYPYGDDGGAAAQVREAGYRVAFGYGGGPISMPPEDLYRVERLAMGPDSDLEAMLDGS
jgi:peptidoglycan/xylan/chitin deacetylase (PgdA/CDA1 family)